MVNLTEGIGFDDLSGGGVDDTWGWVSSAWDLSLDGALVSSERKGNPWHLRGGGLEATLFSVATDDDNLDVLGAVSIPGAVKVFQVSLEWGASTSPRGRVHNHDELVASNAVLTELVTVLINEFISEEVSHFDMFFKIKKLIIRFA